MTPRCSDDSSASSPWLTREGGPGAPRPRHGASPRGVRRLGRGGSRSRLRQHARRGLRDLRDEHERRRGAPAHRCSGRSLRRPSGLFFQIDPAWSPDGSTIAFASKRSGTFDLYAMSRDGSGTRRLTSTKEDDTQPTWSPDGDRIAFARGASSRLFVMNADGSGARRVTDEEARGKRACVVAGRTLDRLRAEKPRHEHPRALAGAPGRFAAAEPDEARRRGSRTGVVAGRTAARILRERGEQPFRHLHDRPRRSGPAARDLARRLVRAVLVARRQDDRLRGSRGARRDRRARTARSRGSRIPTTTTRARRGRRRPKKRPAEAG